MVLLVSYLFYRPVAAVALEDHPLQVTTVGTEASRRHSSLVVAGVQLLLAVVREVTAVIPVLAALQLNHLVLAVTLVAGLVVALKHHSQELTTRARQVMAGLVKSSSRTMVVLLQPYQLTSGDSCFMFLQAGQLTVLS
jgi:hypothetical protein